MSETMAKLITDHLESASIAGPLVIVDLFYHYADSYFPLVSYLTLDSLQQAMASGDYKLYALKDGPIYLDPAPVKEQLLRLFELDFNEKPLPAIGRKMIQKTAAILNITRLYGRIPTHELFGAYACDGTVDGHSSEEWEEILTACGLSIEQRAAWKRHGFY